jgi:hypothetical protein
MPPKKSSAPAGPSKKTVEKKKEKVIEVQIRFSRFMLDLTTALLYQCCVIDYILL